MKKAPVVIKGNKSGIRIVLDQELSFEDLLEEVKNSGKVQIFLVMPRWRFLSTGENWMKKKRQYFFNASKITLNFRWFVLWMKTKSGKNYLTAV